MTKRYIDTRDVVRAVNKFFRVVDTTDRSSFSVDLNEFITYTKPNRTIVYRRLDVDTIVSEVKKTTGFKNVRFDPNGLILSVNVKRTRGVA